MQPLLLKAISLWFLFLPIAIINGVVREKLYKPYVGDLMAHQISTLIAILAFLGVSYFMWRNVVARESTFHLLEIGAMITILTILFEFGFGHYVESRTWVWLLQDYNILKGRIWGLFLLTEFFSVYFIKILQSRL